MLIPDAVLAIEDMHVNKTHMLYLYINISIFASLE